MKLSYKDKSEIYRLWEEENFSKNYIAKHKNINISIVKYLIRLVDIYGIVLRIRSAIFNAVGLRLILTIINFIKVI